MTSPEMTSLDWLVYTTITFLAGFIIGRVYQDYKHWLAEADKYRGEDPPDDQ